ncbi:hypothetical protein F4802DRAFT_152971 [Xylaria palmicola]|nr:hypothetical protein F4802DRAFT_152971 [Xylaria palmicola]
MGLWGYRLFEADADIDVACGLGSALSMDTLSLQALIHQIDMLGQTSTGLILLSSSLASVTNLTPA